MSFCKKHFRIREVKKNLLKYSFLLLSFILITGCKSKKIAVNSNEEKGIELSIVKIPITEVGELQRNKAYLLGKRTLNICNTSVFIPFNESEATQSVIQNTTLEKHSKICRKFRATYGNFKDLKLIEVYKNNNLNELIFRYKAIFEHSNANRELRVTLNDANKVNSLRTLDWKESL